MNTIVKVILEKIGEAITAIEKMDAAELGLAVPPVPMETDGTVATTTLGQINTPVPPVPREPEATQDADGVGAMNMSLPPVSTPVIWGFTTDKEGIPWDERIHSGAKSFMKNGTWKLLRGVDPVLVAQVKTELATAPEGADEDTPDPTPPPVPPAPDDGVMTWAQFMQRVAAASLDPAIVVAACQKVNVANVGILQDFPALVPIVAADLGV